MTQIPHFEKVNLKETYAFFTEDGLHRAILSIPLLMRSSNRTLCIIGQNPSKANEQHADKTIHYLEKYVFEKMPEFSKILMLNLYSRIDTKKLETSNINSAECENILMKTINENSDFLIVFGKLKKEGVYDFPKRAAEISHLLRMKNVKKFDIGSNYAPHPGNRKIFYKNLSHKLNDFDFSDA